MDFSERPQLHHHHRSGSCTELSLSLSSFPSRFSSSSSSMKISTTSFLSPARSALDHHHPMSLPTSLSTRLRPSGSIKAAQSSPMFPSGGKKRSSAFDNPEPSSPKVTCIGQVRVKTRKKSKRTRCLSRRPSAASNVCFRRLPEQHIGSGYMTANSTTHQQQSNNQHQHECLAHRHQRWVHFPLTVCETLRAFGAEFSCLFPCGSSCFSTSERGKEEKRNVSGGNDGDEHPQRSCGAVFARWLLTLQDGEGGKGREIELVVGGDEDTSEASDDNDDIMRKSRRHVLDDFKINEENIDRKGPVGEEEEARVSICIPPKNALLLMRCRSDPMKMAALTHRFWEAPPPQGEEDEEVEEVNDIKDIFGEEVVKEINGIVQNCEAAEELKELLMEETEKPDPIEVDVEISDSCEKLEDDKVDKAESSGGVEHDNLVQEIDLKQIEEVDEEVVEASLASIEALEHNLEDRELEESTQIIPEEEELASRISCSSYTSAFGQGEDFEAEEGLEAPLDIEFPLEEDGKVASEEKIMSSSGRDSQETETQLGCQSEGLGATHKNEEVQDKDMENFELKTERESESDEDHAERRDQFVMKNEGDNVVNNSSTLVSASSASVLPDCLLLMMYEPKLSMEVSKETWVCSTDFTRWLPQRHRQMKPSAAKKDSTNSDEPKKMIGTDSNICDPENPQLVLQNQPPPPPPMVPPRSSCSLPVAAVSSMATMIEQKLVNGAGYEPFVLTRCKSEPMRTAAKILVPDTCYWTNRKLEPLRRAAVHVGATGVGF